MANNQSFRQVIEASRQGKPVPVLDVVRTHTSAAAMISKLIEPRVKNPVSKDSDGNNQISPASIPALFEYSRDIAERSDNSEQVMNLFPETELAAQILISSVISPKDMTKGDVVITAPDNLKSASITARLLTKIREYFDKDYKIKSELPEILRNMLITNGSDPRMVIPENSIDDIINGSSKITLESLSDFIDVKTKEFKSLGFLGNEPKKSTGYIQESFSYESQREYNPNVRFTNGTKEIDSKIKIIDNFAVLRLPEINAKNKKSYIEESIERGRYGINGQRARAANSANQSYGLRSQNTKLSDTDIHSLFYKRKYSPNVPVQKVRTDAEMTRRAVGPALVMKLPSESVIPVYTPGDVKKHVAYFVLLDANGYPLSKHSNSSYLNSLESSLGKQSNNMSSYWLNRANVSLTGRDCNINDVEKASRAFQEVIENEITSRLRNGIDGVSATIASNEEVYRLMFARHLANQMTQVLYVPSELMTYFCYKHDKNGIGISLLENNRLLNSLRAMLLFSRVMAETRNAVGMTKVDIKLDPEDPDPYKTSATVKHAFAKARAENFPLGSIVPIDITDRLQRAGLMFSYSGHPGMPDMEVTAVESNRSFGVPDSNLEDELRKRTVMTLGLTPETVDSAFSPEFATAVTTNNMLLSKRVIQIQEILLPQLSDHLKKVASNDGQLMEEMRQIIIDNYDELLASIEDKDEMAKISENKELVVKMILSEFVSNIEATLPQPDSTTLDSQIENLTKYVEAVDLAIKAYIDSSFFTSEIAGDSSNSVETIAALIKSYFVRKYMAENNIMPEISESLKDIFDIEGQDQFVIDQGMHINYINKAIVSILATTKSVSDGSDADLPTVKSGNAMGGDFGGGDDTSSSDEFGGLDSLDADAGALDGDEQSDVVDEGTSGEPEAEAKPEEQAPEQNGETAPENNDDKAS